MPQISHTLDKARGISAADGSSLARFERAALILFTQSSIDATTTKQIAASAQLSEGLLYRYKKSKMALAEDMFFTIHAKLAGMVREAGKHGDTIDEKAANIVRAYIECADDDWTLFSYHLLTSHRFLHEDRSLDNPVAAVEEIVEIAMTADEIPEADVVLLSAMLLGIVLQPAYHKAFGRLTGNLYPHSDAIIQAVTGLLHQEKTLTPTTLENKLEHSS